MPPPRARIGLHRHDPASGGILLAIGLKANGNRAQPPPDCDPARTFLLSRGPPWGIVRGGRTNHSLAARRNDALVERAAPLDQRGVVLPVRDCDLRDVALLLD